MSLILDVRTEACDVSLLKVRILLAFCTALLSKMWKLVEACDGPLVKVGYGVYDCCMSIPVAPLVNQG